MKRFLHAFVISALATAALAAPASRLAVERALAATAGTRADFVHKFTPKGFTRERVEQGVVEFGAAPKMRWSYEKPEKKTFVFDGTTSWLYAPADRQVTVATLSERDRKGLPFVLLSDASALRAEYIVTETRKANEVRTELRPRNATALVQNLVVVTAARDNALRRIEYADRQGNRTVFQFSNFRKSAATADAFRFDPPKGVEVIRN
ncbi:MAG TPA: outer membrane lipoprotein chaperone LolA [Thermoanaerobaculia bacterium]|nr:outer membrane lipoprotein chaperone LolA [Thermoanaerobaculia bacterium]